jgi:hypothetical protein
MLVICYGIAKSGSTLAYELVKGVLASAGHSQKKLRSAGLKAKRRGNYMGSLARDDLTALIDAIGPERIVAAKTHMVFPDEMFGWLEEMQAARKLQVVASYRDPRDMCLSLVDHGERSRAKGSKDFARIHDLDDAARLIAKAIAKFGKWASLKGSLRLYYDTVAYRPDEAIDTIEAVLGVTGDHAAAKAHAFEDTFTQRNKATRNRYEEELDDGQKREMLENFGPFIARVCQADDQAWYDETRARLLGQGR